MECRVGCGACCIALSISSPIPGMPDGKPAGVRCVQLTADNRCQIFGQPDRPEVCNRLRPNEEMCGQNAGEAFVYLIELERLTSPIAADFDAMRAQAKALLGEQSN
jgi:Fe-S-cluster containining protein